jgi:hypothetical protein
MLLQSQLPVAGRIEMQRGRIRRQDYHVIGKLATIVMDADRDALTPEEEVKILGRRISFTGNWPERDKRKFYPVGLSLDHQDVLLPFGLPLALPQIPLPSWPGAQKLGEETPWIAQNYEDRASGRTRLLDREWWIFRPIHKILMMSVGYFKGVNWPKIVCKADLSGEHMALLFDPLNGEAHFIGGRFEPLTYQEKAADTPILFAP